MKHDRRESRRGGKGPRKSCTGGSPSPRKQRPRSLLEGVTMSSGAWRAGGAYSAWPTWDAHLFPGSPIDSVHSTVTAWSLTCCHLDGRLDRHQPPGFLILHSHNHTELLMPRSPTRRQTLSGACVRNRILRSLWALSPFSVSAAAFSSSLILAISISAAAIHAFAGITVLGETRQPSAGGRTSSQAVPAGQ